MPSSVSGIKEIQKVFRKLPRKMRDKALMSALRAGATVQRKAIKGNAPRDTGFLANNIVSKRVKGRFAIRTGPSRKAFYGGFAEFGTSKIPAKKYIRNAFHSTSVDVKKKVSVMLVKAIAREAKKLRGPLRKSGALSRKGFLKQSGL